MTSLIAPIYLDGFSTLPLAPEARDAMLDAWSNPGNAASPHAAGERAARLIADARAEIAYMIGAASAEIVFTSGATEANNLAILGAARAALRTGDPRRRIVISAIEHKSVLEPVRALESEGFSRTVAPVDRFGRVALDELRRLVDEQTLLVSIMAVNNETGVIQPLTEAAEIAHAAGALFHSDAAQAFGKITLDVQQIDADYLSLSAHKCYGPMGIGALYIASGVPRPVALTYGGGQQSALRPGTEPVALIAGFAAATAAARSRLPEDTAHGARLVERLEAELLARQVRFTRVSGGNPIVPGGLTIALDGVDADSLCTMLARTVQISTGSACSSGQIKFSHVLDSMGYSDEDARGVVRLFFSRYNREEDVERAAQAISEAILRFRLATGEVRQ